MLDTTYSILEFIPETHQYRLNGVVIPGVTEIIRAAGLSVDAAFFTEQAAWRGSAVHYACRLDNERDLDMATVDERILPYLNAWQTFKRDMAFHPSSTERMQFGELYGMRFAGTPDCEGLIGLLPATVDLKTGPVRPEAALQLAAYTILTGMPTRIAVRLKPTGKYELKTFPAQELRTDLNQFRSALANWHWKNNR